MSRRGYLIAKAAREVAEQPSQARLAALTGLSSAAITRLLATQAVNVAGQQVASYGTKKAKTLWAIRQAKRVR